MRQKNMLIPTLRHVGAEAEMASHRLMLRAGMIRQLAAGVYTYLPLAYRTLRKVEQVVREEMDRIGAQELLLPAMNPAELWKESGRWETYGPELVKLQDRHEREFLLGPTHEEVITDLVRNEVNSYKKLPMALYQIQTKFRDERRPRSGLLRGREFLMKDAYSFHADQETLDETYQDMYEAYRRIFTRLGLDFRAVEADSGAIGGSENHEFMVLSESGEDTLALCGSCDYAANIETAEVGALTEAAAPTATDVPGVEKVSTPRASTIDEVTRMLGKKPEELVKSLLFTVDGEPVLVLVRGDHEANEVKVKHVLDAEQCELADDDTVRRVTGSPAGFAGPVGLKQPVKVVADHAVKGMREAVVGANEADAHLVHVRPARDFQVDLYADVRTAQEGDACPRCGGTLRFSRGIEVGHVFKLGTRYSEAMNATFLDREGKERPYIMGCYGIGISRVVAAIVEQCHDENGIIWPSGAAPYQVHLIAVNPKDPDQSRLAEELYAQLTADGIEVLFDDRQERAGVKFKDADLLGIPLRITVGKMASDGRVEYKFRRSGKSGDLSAEELPLKLPDLLKKADEK
ncbi:prolyl-tRNA synthetase [Melghirimyces profundicolus]|uniref:Proline--tRNA ligase n=1 Tax=Melghirimyces profundicolus TaxID=1242148 RepID=A0A2T6BRL1_9BACL|nr:proline--tRNA ligase [Melghirimyces profundicolus]PTX58617.1 prolyl-tRNA synthetase [Melghirimyces profundicolus]